MLHKVPQRIFHHNFLYLNRAISKLLGERWRELSEDKREEFARSAKEMADERMKVNPDCWKRKVKKELGQPGTPMSVADTQIKVENLTSGNSSHVMNNNNNNINEFDAPSEMKKIK